MGDMGCRMRLRGTYVQHEIAEGEGLKTFQDKLTLQIPNAQGGLPLNNDINHLHQLILNLAARLQATEAIATAAISLACAMDEKKGGTKDKFLKETFPLLLKNAATAPAQATKPELDQWMRQREQDFLNANLQKITAQIEQLCSQTKTKAHVN